MKNILHYVEVSMCYPQCSILICLVVYVVVRWWIVTSATLYTLAASVGAGCTQGQCRVQRVRWEQQGYNKQVQQTGNLVYSVRLCGCRLYPGSVQGTEGQMGTAGLQQTGNLVYSGRLCGCRLYPGSVQGTEGQMGTAGLQQTGNLGYSGRLCGCRLYPGSVQGTEGQMGTTGLQQTGTTDR